MSDVEQIHTVFFLKLKDQLDNDFIRLSVELSDYGCMLLPIDFSNLSTVLSAQNNNVICIIKTIAELEKFKKIRNNFFQLGILSGKVNLIEITSFSETPNSLAIHKKGTYKSIRLPMPVEYIGKKICQFIFENDRSLERWPGGKRAKLPADINNG
ncbi:MAG: hypothetical protein H6622_11385 [Halobacteriovoraceae bacterium]|nr:hypothetical protein [Halobacteriovoraceae bacterium]